MIPNHKGEIPVVLLLLPFLSGIGFGHYLLRGLNITPVYTTFFILGIVFILLNFNYSRFRLYKYRWLGGTL
ncbi:MAG TPA: hypothetical protein VIJ27_03300, partial [Mucilaginibacter sp.]